MYADFVAAVRDPDGVIRSRPFQARTYIRAYALAQERYGDALVDLEYVPPGAGLTERWFMHDGVQHHAYRVTETFEEVWTIWRVHFGDIDGGRVLLEEGTPAYLAALRAMEAAHA